MSGGLRRKKKRSRWGADLDGDAAPSAHGTGLATDARDALQSLDEGQKDLQAQPLSAKGTSSRDDGGGGAITLLEVSTITAKMQVNLQYNQTRSVRKMGYHSLNLSLISIGKAHISFATVHAEP